MALFLLILVVFASHTAYVFHSRQYPQWDEHNYLSLAIKYLDIFHSWDGNVGARMLAVSGYLQPVYSLILSLFLLIFGTNYTYTIALLLNGLFFVTSMVGVYALSIYLFNRTTAILAAVVFAGLGNALFYSHFTYTETAVTAFIVWTIALLAYSNGFTVRKYALVAALVGILAILTRWIAIVFIIGPLGVEILRWFFPNKKPEWKATLENLLASMGMLFGIPAFVYFIPNWGEFSGYIARNQQNGAEWVATYRFAEMTNTFSTRSVMYYFNILSQNGVYIFAAFVLGFSLCVAKFKRTASLLLGFLIPYGFLTFIAVWKEDRFLVPLYPMVASIAASIVYPVRSKLGVVVIASFLIGISVLTYVGGIWGAGPLGKRGLTDVVLPSFIHHPRRIYLTSLVWPPTKEYVNAHLITQTISQTHPSYAPTPVVIGAFSFEPLENAFLSITSYHHRMLMEYRKNPSSFTDADYVLTKSNDSAGTSFEQSGAFSSFRFIANIPVPMDNSWISIYKHEN